VISKKALKECWQKHPKTEQALKAWYKEMCLGKWSNPNQLKLDFPSASILSESRVVFNIKGNHYRLVVRINFSFQMIWIRFVGTHQEYDNIDANLF
jgi:mRNA interferase HigB